MLHQTVKKISLKPDPLTTWKFYMHCTLYVLSTVVYSCMKLYLKLHVHVEVNTLRALLSRSIKFTNKKYKRKEGAWLLIILHRILLAEINLNYFCWRNRKHSRGIFLAFLWYLSLILLMLQNVGREELLRLILICKCKLWPKIET